MQPSGELTGDAFHAGGKKDVGQMAPCCSPQDYEKLDTGCKFLQAHPTSVENVGHNALSPESSGKLRKALGLFACMTILTGPLVHAQQIARRILDTEAGKDKVGELDAYSHDDGSLSVHDNWSDRECSDTKEVGEWEDEETEVSDEDGEENGTFCVTRIML